ncbi:MAG: MAPEG family protein [Pseudomonadota bacterium]
MTTPFWCLLVAVLIPYILAGSSAYFRIKQFGKPDNKNPRAQAAELEGAGARAVAAQNNAWEALAVFSVAVFVAHLAGADAATSATIAMVFIAARILHAVFYIANLDILRSLSFIVGIGCCIYLFVLAANA